jgi:hypothetical protein
VAESITTRLALPRWTAATDTPNRTEFDSAFQNLEERAAGFVIWDSTDDGAGNPTIARPAAAVAYESFFAWDRASGQMTVCMDTTGAGGWAWVEIGPEYLTEAEGNAAYVNVDGDTMTGTLTAPKFYSASAIPGFYFEETDAGNPDPGSFWHLLVDGDALRLDHIDSADVRSIHRFTVYKDGRFHFRDGSAAAPILSFVGDADTGIYRPTGNAIAFATAGGFAGGFYGGFLGGPVLRLPDGAVGTPAFSFLSDSDTGIYRISADRMALAARGQAVLQVMDDASTNRWARPGADNIFAFGGSTARWTEVYAVNGTIQTSDVNEKTNVRSIGGTAALDRVRRTAANAIQFEWRNGKRTHAGFSAQGVGQEHGADTAAYIDPAVEADARTNPYSAAEPTAEWYADYVDADADADEQAEQRAEAESEWVEARDEFDAETEAMRVAPKGIRPAELVPDLYAAIAEQQRQIEAQQATIADLVARVETLENA